MSTFSVSNTTKFSLATNFTFGSDRSKTSNGYHDLPKNVLVRIFRNFTEEQLLQSVIPVCQNWKYAALDPSLWRKLTIKGSSLTPAQICQRIRKFKQLEHVFLRKVPKSLVVLRQVIMCAKRLKRVSLRYCEGIRESSLRHMVQVCTNLEAIDLKGTEFYGYKFYQDLSTLQKLKSINFSGNTLLKKDNILTVGLNCRGLEEFLLSFIKTPSIMTESEWCFVIGTLSPNLKSISIDASTIGDSAFHTIIQCCQIEAIGFCNAYNLTGDIFLKLTEYPVELKSLKLRYAHLIQGLQFREAFADPVMSKLEVLDLTGCWKLTDEAIEAISTCRELKRLLLKSCKRITTLDPIISRNDKLQELNIAFCNNLVVNTSLIGMRNLALLFINEDKKFKELLRLIRNKGKFIRVKLCVSEFNKSCEDLINNKISFSDLLKDSKLILGA